MNTPKLVMVANNQKMRCEGHGDVELKLKGHKQTTKIKQVMFNNLISVGKMTR